MVLVPTLKQVRVGAHHVGGAFFRGRVAKGQFQHLVVLVTKGANKYYLRLHLRHVTTFQGRCNVMEGLASRIFVFKGLFPIGPSKVPMSLRRNLVSIFASGLLFLLLFFLVVRRAESARG